MSFTDGFFKLAAEPVVFSALANAAKKGLSHAGGSTIKDALKLKGLSHIGEAVKKSGGLGKSFTTQAGREALAEGVGKAAPSLGAAAAYGVGAKKVYNKVSENDNRGQGGY
jgi:hypothetical protein